MKDLTQRLRKLADTLDSKAGEFEGTAWNRAVTGFAKALERFENTTQDAAQNLAPGWRDLTRIFESPDKKHLDAHALKQLFKKILDKKAPPDATPAAMRKAFLAELKKTGSARKTLALTEEILAEARAPQTKPPKDREALQRELYRLGGLDDDQREYELGKRFPSSSDLKHFAKTVGIILPKDAKKDEVTREIITMARRVHGHVLL